MEHMQPMLPAEIESAVETSHGGPVVFTGEHGQYVVMTTELYGAAMAGTPEDLAASVEGVKRSLAQAAAGQARDADEVLDELDSRYAS